MPPPDVQSAPGAAPRFSLGRIVATPAALAALVVAKVWIITEADRSATTLLLPDEY